MLLNFKYLLSKLGLVFFFSIVFSFVMGQSIYLTEEEKEWLKYHPIIYHGYDSNWQPLEFIDEKGEYSGIASSIIDILGEKIGVEFKTLPCENWEDAIRKIKRKEALILPALMKNEERENYLNFTKPYQEYGFVIVSATHSEFIGGLLDLIGKKLALPRNYYVTDLLKKEYPELDIIEFDDVNACLLAVSMKNADATIGNLAVISHFLNYSGYENLKIACPTALKPIKLSIGVNKTEPILRDILQRGLDSISTKEMNSIVQKWVSVRYEHGVNIDKVWKNVYIGIGITLLLFLIGFLYNQHLKKQIQLRKIAESELKHSLDKIQEQKLLIEEKNKEVLDSIQYAKRIQNALLPSDELLDQNFKDSFVYYRPKDIVAGDFYWFDRIGEYKFVAAADCTGHGVPGAMVSVVCHNALQRSVLEFGLRDPGEILDKTREIVINTFSKYDKNINDGMDIALLVYHEERKELKFAGANNSLYMVDSNKNELLEIKPDKQPVGNYMDLKPFTSHQINLSKGSKVYLFSDGFADQFGGEKGKKLKYKEFKNRILQYSDLKFHEQKQSLSEFFENWIGEFEQNDDVLVMGFDFKP